jgi:hypothetical protein
MDAAQTALYSVAAMEATAHASCASAAAGTPGGTGMGLGQQRPGTLVECRGQPHEPCLPGCLLRQSRAAVTSDGAQPPQSRVMKRRVGNPTHGGVGGRRGQPRLLPDRVRYQIKADMVLRERDAKCHKLPPHDTDDQTACSLCGPQEVRGNFAALQ